LAQLAKCCADTVSAYSESPTLRRTHELKGRLLVQLPATDMDWLNDAARQLAQSDPVDWARLAQAIQVLRAAQPDPRNAALADTILGIERGAVLSEVQFQCLRGAIYLLGYLDAPSNVERLRRCASRDFWAGNAFVVDGYDGRVDTPDKAVSILRQDAVCAIASLGAGAGKPILRELAGAPESDTAFAKALESLLAEPEDVDPERWAYTVVPVPDAAALEAERHARAAYATFDEVRQRVPDFEALAREGLLTAQQVALGNAGVGRARRPGTIEACEALRADETAPYEVRRWASFRLVEMYRALGRIDEAVRVGEAWIAAQPADSADVTLRKRLAEFYVDFRSDTFQPTDDEVARAVPRLLEPIFASVGEHRLDVMQAHVFYAHWLSALGNRLDAEAYPARATPGTPSWETRAAALAVRLTHEEACLEHLTHARQAARAYLEDPTLSDDPHLPASAQTLLTALDKQIALREGQLVDMRAQAERLAVQTDPDGLIERTVGDLLASP
ncbi:MAG: hypothetical protein JXR94_06370, partial [Candidatus Hydrogenedentes bacterium]|nr:hypothetical protein [Candidatus Hydrogenedentota bacterium]